MRKARAQSALVVLSLLAAACGGGSETIWVRLVDEFGSASVQGTPATPEPERTEWRFDGEGSVPEPEENAATVGWTVLNDVTGFTVRDGMLVGTTGSVPELTDEARESMVEGITNQGRPQLQAELTPRDDFLTYTLREAGVTIRLGAMRNLLLQPSDAEGAEFEIESMRINPLKEHLASVPSGPGWHGPAEIYHETIVSRSPERIVLDVELPERPWLDLAYGTIEDGSVPFEVAVTAAGGESSVFSRTVTTPDRWSTARVDLSEFAGEPVALALTPDAEAPGTQGYWG